MYKHYDFDLNSLYSTMYTWCLSHKGPRMVRRLSTSIAAIVSFLASAVAGYYVYYALRSGMRIVLVLSVLSLLVVFVAPYTAHEITSRYFAKKFSSTTGFNIYEKEVVSENSGFIEEYGITFREDQIVYVYPALTQRKKLFLKIKQCTPMIQRIRKCEIVGVENDNGVLLVKTEDGKVFPIIDCYQKIELKNLIKLWISTQI